MTDKTKMSNLESYTELSIQIATVDMKLDAILKLLNKPETFITGDDFTIIGGAPGHGAMCTGVIDSLKPTESHTDYLKRIDQYNEAQSEDEFYGEVYK